MTIMSIGEGAVLIYDREYKTCVIVCVTLVPLPDAIAIVRGLNPDTVWIIAPTGAEEYVTTITPTDDFKLYWFK